LIKLLKIEIHAYSNFRSPYYSPSESISKKRSYRSRSRGYHREYSRSPVRRTEPRSPRSPSPRSPDRRSSRSTTKSATLTPLSPPKKPSSTSVSASIAPTSSLRGKISDTSLFAELIKDKHKRAKALKALEEKTEKSGESGSIIDLDGNSNSNSCSVQEPPNPEEPRNFKCVSEFAGNGVAEEVNDIPIPPTAEWPAVESAGATVTVNTAMETIVSNENSCTSQQSLKFAVSFQAEPWLPQNVIGMAASFAQEGEFREISNNLKVILILNFLKKNSRHSTDLGRNSRAILRQRQHQRVKIGRRIKFERKKGPINASNAAGGARFRGFEQ
jgi:hypothetical protein